MRLPQLAPGRHQRRITIAYRVLDPLEGEAVLEREISHAHMRAWLFPVGDGLTTMACKPA
ncbi:hypothetical protein [Streptomyces sp. NPDC003401]